MLKKNLLLIDMIILNLTNKREKKVLEKQLECIGEVMKKFIFLIEKMCILHFKLLTILQQNMRVIISLLSEISFWSKQIKI
jgi:hypothetical protein